MNKNSMIFPDQRVNPLQQIRQARILSVWKLGINYTGFAMNPFQPKNFKIITLSSILGICIWTFTKD